MYVGQIGECTVEVLLTGVGCRSTRFALQHFLQAGLDLCVSTGLAGGLRDGLRIGDVVAARRAVARGSGAQIASSAALVAAAAACGARTVDVCLTSNELAVTAEQKRKLAVDGDIVEMESFHVLRAAAAAKVPAVVVRAISDIVDEDLPMNFDLLMDSEGELSVRKLLGSLARDPAKIPAMARFGRKSRGAAQALAGFLDRYLAEIAPQPEGAKSMALREAAG